MSATITVRPDPNLAALFGQLAELPQLALTAVAKGLQTAAPIIAGAALKTRFLDTPGPFPISENKLGRVIGRLRQSVASGFDKPQINAADGSVSMLFGSNVKYFAFHEFGFTGSIPVRAHTRRNGASVRAHSRQINYEGRQPMQTHLREQATTDTILDQVRRAVVRAIDAAGKGGTP
jgi:phage gpG-like protein